MRRIILAAVLLVAAAAPLDAQVYYRTTVTPRGWLGIQFSTLVSNVNGSSSSVVIINDVTKDSPADRAGIEAGDTLLRVNDFRASSELLGSMGSSVEPGDTVRFVVKRDGREREFRIAVAERPAGMTIVGGNRLDLTYTIDPDSVRGRARLFVDSMYASLDTAHFRGLFRFDTAGGFRTFIGDSTIFGSLPGQVFEYSVMTDSARNKFSVSGERFRTLTMDSLVRGGFMEFTAPDISFDLDADNLVMRGFMRGARAFAGADLANVDPDLGEYFGTRTGVLVLRVPDGTPADRAGLEAGDVITKVDGKTVSGVQDLRTTAERVGPRAPIRIEVLRHRKSVNLEMRRD